MVRQVIAPKRTAPAAVAFEPWNVSIASDSAEAAPLGEMPPWDYSMALRFSCEVFVDLERAISDCGLPPTATFALVAFAECRDTYWRAADVHPARTGRMALSVRVPAGVAANSLRLGRRLVVQSAPPSSDVLVPAKGHVVAGADDATTVVLEGDGGRFPTQAISFSEVGLPADAPWHLSLSYDDPTDSFAGSVQLLLNTDHERVARMIGENPDSADAADVQAHLAFDVARQLIMQAVRDDRLDSSKSWEEDSVGAVLESVCARTRRRNATGCRAAVAQDPQGFETELKAQLGYMR